MLLRGPPCAQSGSPIHLSFPGAPRPWSFRIRPRSGPTSEPGKLGPPRSHGLKRQNVRQVAMDIGHVGTDNKQWQVIRHLPCLSGHYRVRSALNSSQEGKSVWRASDWHLEIPQPGASQRRLRLPSTSGRGLLSVVGRNHLFSCGQKKDRQKVVAHAYSSFLPQLHPPFQITKQTKEQRRIFDSGPYCARLLI